MKTSDVLMLCLASALFTLFGIYLCAELSAIAQRRRERRAAKRMAKLEALRPLPLPVLTVGEPAPMRRVRSKAKLSKADGIEANR